MSDEKSITIKKSDLWKYSTFLLLAVVLIGGYLAFSGGTANGNTVNNGNTGNSGNTGSSLVSASVDDDPVLGDENAPVTIIEFSDYQCPYCRKFWTETLPQLKSEYIDTGKARLVYRDLPIPALGHDMAIVLAEAAECVREQGGDEAYFEMHDKIYEEQNILDGGDPKEGPVQSTVKGFSEEDIVSWASDLGYNIQSCLDSGKYESEIQKDLADAQATKLPSERGVGTPRFIVKKTGEDEGIVVSGAQPFSAFKQVIDSI